MDPRLDRLLATLDVEFDAALDRDESEAANDLAFSLVQDRSLPEVLGDGGWEIASPVGNVPVQEIGVDYVAGAGWIFSLHLSTFRSLGPGPRPVSSTSSLLERMRLYARRGITAQLVLPEEVIQGRLVACGRDYVVIRSIASERLIPMGLVAGFRPSLED